MARRRGADAVADVQWEISSNGVYDREMIERVDTSVNLAKILKKLYQGLVPGSINLFGACQPRLTVQTYLCAKSSC